MRRNDWILFASVLVVAVLLMLICQRRGTGNALYAELLIDGECVAMLSLEEDTSYRWADGNQYLEVTVEAGRARIKDASCPDKLCVRRGMLAASGEAAVCLPNHAVLSLTGEDGLDAVVR